MNTANPQTIHRVMHEIKRRKLEVLRVVDLTPRMRRITVGGPELAGFSNLPEDTADSIARIEVVPTAQIRLFSFNALFTTLAWLSSIMNCSESILCFVKSSTSTDLNVPKPT